MSQHISGEVGQRISQDFGEFMTVGNVRVRKELISIYFGLPTTQKLAEGIERWVINIYAGAWLSALFDSEVERNSAIEKLDWIYKKDQAK